MNGDVVLGVVHPTEVGAHFWVSYDRMRSYDLAHDRRIAGRISEPSSANISAARNTIARKFLDTEAAWLLLVDADMHWHPEALDELLAVADPDKAPIVGGLCFGIADGTAFPTLYQLVKEADGGVGTVRYDDFPRDSMFQVSATGAAFLLVHRSVFEAIAAKEFSTAFPWFQETVLSPQTPKPCGEDVTFCIRAGICEFPIWVHTGVAIGHVKPVVVDLAMYERQRTAADITTAERVE